MDLGLRLMMMVGYLAVMFGTARSASAVGVSLQPERLRLAAGWGQTASGEILVSNPSDRPARYSITSDAAQIQPADFRLDPGSSQLVRLTAASRWPWRRQLALAVVARPLGTTGFGVASGVRYPIELAPVFPFISFLIRGLLLLSLGAATWWAWRRRFRHISTNYVT